MMGLVDLALTQERLVKIAVTDTSCCLVAEVANLQLGDMLWVQDEPCQYEIKGRPVVSHGIQCGGHGQGHGEAAAENEPLWGSMMNVGPRSSSGTGRQECRCHWLSGRC